MTQSVQTENQGQQSDSLQENHGAQNKRILKMDSTDNRQVLNKILERDNPVGQI